MGRLYRYTVHTVNYPTHHGDRERPVRNLGHLMQRPSKRDSITPARRDATGGIQVINRAARILRALRDRPEGLSLGQLAERVDLPRSTVQRIVQALVTERMLMAATPSGRVRLGTEILALAGDSKIDVVEIAHQHLKALSAATGE